MDNNSQQSANMNSESEGSPNLRCMWPYPLPVEKFPQFQNFFQEGNKAPMPQATPSIVTVASENNSSPSVSQVQVMGTLQTVLTTGISTTPQVTQVSTPVVVSSPSQHQEQPTQFKFFAGRGSGCMYRDYGPISITVPAPAGAEIVRIEKVEPSSDPNILTRKRLQDLVREVDPNEQLDEDVEEILLQIADDFVESAVTAACLLAKHRKATTVDVKDLQLHLERVWNMWIPGFGTDELRPYKRSSVTEAHKQRLTLIRKTLKKY